MEQRREEELTTLAGLQAQRAKVRKKVTNLLGEFEDIDDPEVRSETRKRVQVLGRERSELDRQVARPVEPSETDIAALRVEAGRMATLLEGALTNDPAET